MQCAQGLVNQTGARSGNPASFTDSSFHLSENPKALHKNGLNLHNTAQGLSHRRHQLLIRTKKQDKDSTIASNKHSLKYRLIKRKRFARTLSVSSFLGFFALLLVVEILLLYGVESILIYLAAGLFFATPLLFIIGIIMLIKANKDLEQVGTDPESIKLYEMHQRNRLLAIKIFVGISAVCLLYLALCFFLFSVLMLPMGTILAVNLMNLLGIIIISLIISAPTAMILQLIYKSKPPK